MRSVYALLPCAAFFYVNLPPPPPEDHGSYFAVEMHEREREKAKTIAGVTGRSTTVPTT